MPREHSSLQGPRVRGFRRGVPDDGERQDPEIQTARGRRRTLRARTGRSRHGIGVVPAG
ncbi:MAG: hypothetical protein M3283_02225 [Actinomycetota bacterium]|nr:hypothetical protein [Actinomycetota bacterium]